MLQAITQIAPVDWLYSFNLSDYVMGLLWALYETKDPVLHLAFLVIVVCSISVFTLTVLLFMHRFRSLYQNKRSERLREKYSLLLTGIIFDEEDAEFEGKRQKLIVFFRKRYLKSRFNKRVLRKQLLLLHKSFSGPSQEVLRGLYFELKLHKEALAQLQIADWSEKADAIKELSQMGYTEAKSKIAKLTTHENKVLRLEAQAAMLSLNEEDPFGFLARSKDEMTEWQQLNLEEKAMRLDLKKIPNFSKWFNLQNQSVVEFCVKMTVAYNQFESADELIKLLQSPNERVLRQAVKAIGTLLINEAQPILFEIYADVSPEIKNEIIAALGKIGSEEGVAFLEELLFTAEHEFAINAGQSLQNMGFEGGAVLQKALTSEHPRVSSIALHVLDDRIKSR